jgi:spore coat-associated protein N
MARHAAPRPLHFLLPAKVSLGSVAGLSAIALVGAGTFAAWQSTTGGTTGTYSAGSVTASEADTNGTTFSSAVSNLLPGDYAYRYRVLSNTGSVSQVFTGAVTGAGTLASTAGGLTIAVDSCSVAWTTVSGVSTCSGTTTNLLATTGVSTSPSISYGTLAASGTQNLRYTLALPSAANQATFQGTSGTVTVAITGAGSGTGDRTAG